MRAGFGDAARPILYIGFGALLNGGVVTAVERALVRVRPPPVILIRTVIGDVAYGGR